MRIVFVHTDLRMYWPPRLFALGRALRKRGDEFLVIEIAGNGSPYDFGSQNGSRGELVWFVLFPEGDLRRMSGHVMARAVERKLDELRPDVIMAGGIAFPSGAAAIRWARRNRRGVVIFDDARSQDVPRSRMVESVKRRLYANVDAMLIPAESHAPSYARWGVDRHRMSFGLNVIDNEQFSSRSDVLRTHAAECRRIKGLPPKFFLGVGRHVEKKNWAMCLEAYRQYRLKGGELPWGLVLVGDGPDHARLNDLVRQRQIPGVELPGVIQGENLVAYYAVAGALVLPSLYGETWGLVVNEAMACALPVLVSDCCGCARTLVREGVNGWTFAPARPEELAARMSQMSSFSDEARLQMGTASRRIISAWGLERFVEGAQEAIGTCKDVDRGFVSFLDRLLITLWNGRFRPA